MITSVISQLARFISNEYATRSARESTRLPTLANGQGLAVNFLRTRAAAALIAEGNQSRQAGISSLPSRRFK